jgi:hypothetical protein
LLGGFSGSPSRRDNVDGVEQIGMLRNSEDSEQNNTRL